MVVGIVEMLASLFVIVPKTMEYDINGRNISFFVNYTSDIKS